MGKIPPLAFNRRAADSAGIDDDFLGPSGLVIDCKDVYIAVTYCILVLGYTCVNIPYGTLCGAMTQNIEERAKINTFRSVSAMIAIGIINIITVPLIAALGKGNDRRGYLLIAVIYGCIFAACHIFCFAKTKEVVEVPEKE